MPFTWTQTRGVLAEKRSEKWCTLLILCSCSSQTRALARGQMAWRKGAKVELLLITHTIRHSPPECLTSTWCEGGLR